MVVHVDHPGVDPVRDGAAAFFVARLYGRRETVLGVVRDRDRLLATSERNTEDAVEYALECFEEAVHAQT